MERDTLIQQPGATREEEAAVLATHEIFWQSYAQRDLDARFAVCAPDVTFFGTAQHERAVGIEQYRAMNQLGVDQYPQSFIIEYLWKEVRMWGDTAWVECDTWWIDGGWWHHFKGSRAADHHLQEAGWALVGRACARQRPRLPVARRRVHDHRPDP